VLFPLTVEIETGTLTR